MTNTKPIPVITALLAGLVVCVVSFLQQTDMTTFAIHFIMAVLGFFLLGFFFRLILDGSLKKSAKVEEKEEEEDEEEGETESTLATDEQSEGRA
ncbi:hypothetical protein FACS1894111_02670 [Clostridia bacterium]|nr:hypothetical protein FACS1894111_02670 [Clostridia bacterium]